MDPAVYRIVMAAPFRCTERLIDTLATAPLVPLHEVDREATRIVKLGRSQPLRTRPDKRTPTTRQLRALELYASGLTYQQVGAAMGIAEDTVKDHMSRARLALGAAHTGHAIAIAYRRKLLS